MNGILSLLVFAPVIGVIFIWARGRVKGDNDDSVRQRGFLLHHEDKIHNQRNHTQEKGQRIIANIARLNLL